MFLLRLDLASLQLLDEVRMHFGDEAALHQVENVHLRKDGGDQAVDFEGCRLMALGLADHHLLHQ
ncbi:hypothetical protein EN41_11155 [Agrobacterium tumefaciens]|uniref:hypothetical protein n=1 Tax=Agrobacterium tumefaciens complex TaxID=1183400 RepID=UPI0004D392D3|nr:MULTISPECIES: hypothetical protein [Agrobacterium tumefaciens complex]KEY49997.1 hypothetical protein EN41_11155 [Agrobacterium tumefaciens]MCX2878492.1 hypothetical protein [Agrobacterium fabrum]NMV73011.1 hypothetical protein [Agrobacterium fabrum]QQN08870.1 hypothetical protein EML4058_22825 [Agrobacterium fabrum]QQN13934.1 hypothetical protein EML540_22825 [Agrobacterium fabrum]